MEHMEQVAHHKDSLWGSGRDAVFSESISHPLSHLPEVNYLSHAKEAFHLLDSGTGTQYYSAVWNAGTMSLLWSWIFDRYLSWEFWPNVGYSQRYSWEHKVYLQLVFIIVSSILTYPIKALITFDQTDGSTGRKMYAYWLLIFFFCLHIWNSKQKLASVGQKKKDCEEDNYQKLISFSKIYRYIYIYIYIYNIYILF